MKTMFNGKFVTLEDGRVEVESIDYELGVEKHVFNINELAFIERTISSYFQNEIIEQRKQRQLVTVN